MRNKVTAGLLGILFGSIGLHRFYLGEAGAGCGYLFLALFFPPLTMLIGLIEGLQLLGMDDAMFNARYNGGPPVQVNVQVSPGVWQTGQTPGSVPTGQPVAGGPMGSWTTAAPGQGAGRPTAEPRGSGEPWYRTYRPRGVAEQERVVLAVVRDQAGSVTPADVALASQISLQQASDVLRQMELLGVCQTEYDPETGLARYNFPEFMPQRQQAEPYDISEEIRLGTRRLD